MSVNIVLIGDAETGKTSLVQVMGTNKFLEEYSSNVADKYQVEAEYDDQAVTMHIWDLGSQDSIQRNQQQAFAEADIFMICFDLSQKTTLDSVSKWVEEIESSEKKDVPRVLVGCKSDLRGNLATQD